VRILAPDSSISGGIGAPEFDFYRDILVTDNNKILDYKLSGRVAVITGAGGGMGAAIAHLLARSGADIALLDLHTKNLELIVNELTALGHRPLPLTCNVADESAVERAAQHVVEHFGRCDILVNNAGMLLPACPLEEITVDDWDQLQAVNLRSVFLCAKHFSYDMLRRRTGIIVNIASIAAREPNASGAYGASKAAVAALSRQMAVEWGPRGIRCNSVSPGFIETPMSVDFYASPGVRERRTAMVASRSIGEPLDIASAVAFLSSDASSFINGQDLVVDGGFTITSLMRAQPDEHQPRT